jgi:hypothetical protein
MTVPQIHPPTVHCRSWNLSEGNLSEAAQLDQSSANDKPPNQTLRENKTHSWGVGDKGDKVAFYRFLRHYPLSNSTTIHFSDKENFETRSPDGGVPPRFNTRRNSDEATNARPCIVYF